MASERTGSFGAYYGSEWGTSDILTTAQMQINATYVYSALNMAGWTENAIAAILGNMQAESGINPGRWQSDDVGNESNGYGLVQWTPSTNYTLWCAAEGFDDPSEMDSNLARILHEWNNNLQWISTISYPLSFKEFGTSNETVAYLAKAFVVNYERPADQSATALNNRAALAESWFEYITGRTPTPENPGTSTESTGTKRKRYNFLIFNQARKRNHLQRRRNEQWTKRHF